MNKLSVLLVMLLLVTGALMADISTYYTFASSAGTYTAITGTPVTDAVGDDVISAPITIGFPFTYGLNSYTQVKVSSNGYVALGATVGSTLTNQLVSTTYCPVLAPLWDDTEVPATGNVQYLLEGTAPNRIFTIQYTGVEWNYSATNGHNYQVKMYESNGKVEFIYGTPTGTAANASASIGMNMLPGGATNYWSVTPGNPATASNTAENTTIAAFPAPGTTYTFNPPVAVPNDMAATGITGPTTPNQGTAATYTVSVRNSGTAASVAYTVKLFNGTTELASVTGPALAPGATQDVPVVWTPAAIGPAVLTGKVVAPGDQNPANDQTAALNVNVLSPGSQTVLMSNGTLALADGTTCLFYDSGGATGPYQNSENFTFVFTATSTAAVLQAVFNTFDVENGWDFLKVYDGPNIQAPQIGPATGYSGATAPGTILGTANAMTFVFTSDTSVTPAGWDAVVTPVSMGSLNGTVTSAAAPVPDATITLSNSTLTQTTTATGTYNFPFVPAGTYDVTCTKVGYITQTLPATITTSGAVTLNFNLVALPMVTVSGTVFGSDQPTVGLAGVTVAFDGAADYSATTNASGAFSVSVLASSAYAYTMTKPGYQAATGNITVGATNYTVPPVTLNEIALPAAAVQAAENAGHTAVNVTWSAPGTAGGEWLTYAGDNNDSIGTGGTADFDVAIRFPASELTDFAGMSLYTLRLWPAQAGTFSARVWTGGTATAPGTMVIDQPFTPTLDQYNDVVLATPVVVTGNEELWFGYRCNVTSGYPAGCDAGPAIDGFGNMMYWQGAWTTLVALAPTLNYNWNIEGYVGFSAPTIRVAPMTALPFNADRMNTGTLATFGKVNKLQNATVVSHTDEIRVLVGYKVYRLLQGQETNEAAWTTLTPNPITATAYTDGGWGSLADGIYKWAIKAVYTNNVMAIPAFSNAVQRLTQVGTIAGIVRSAATNAAIPGATITAGTYTATSNASGAYTMAVPAGTHTVTCSAAGYTTGSQAGVVVVTGQTTNVNFNLAVATTVEDGFETYGNFVIDFAPWTNVDVDQSTTYSYTNYTWENMQTAQAFMVFNPAATTPASTEVIGAPHGGEKMATCWAGTTPPNNDWLISPVYNVGAGAEVSFWARSMTDEYGLERFKVGFSTGGTAPANFTILSGANYVQAPIEWTLYTYALPTGTSGNVRIGIQCVSNDAFCFQLDDYVMNLGTHANNDPVTPVVTTALHGTYPNPFNPNTTISYSVKGTTPVTVEIYNAKGQRVKTLVSETKAQGNYKVEWNGTDNNGHKVTSGVYFYKMSAGKFSSSKKMILMK